MARKEETVVVPATGGRDAGKHFHIVEMSSYDAHWWAVRMCLLLSRGGFIPEECAGRGMEMIFVIGANSIMRSNIQPDELRPLWDQIMGCVQIVRDPSARDAAGKTIKTPLASADDIEEPGTQLWLRSEVLRLHMGFSPADMLSAFLSQIRATEEKTISS